MFNQHFTRRVPTQAKWMFVLVILPLYVYCGSLILSALFKFVIIQFQLEFDYNQLNAYLNLIFDVFLLGLAGWLLKDSMLEQWRDFKKNLNLIKNSPTITGRSFFVPFSVYKGKENHLSLIN